MNTINDLQRYIPEYNEDGTEKHIICEGARFHVISYSQEGMKCSEPNCEINKLIKIILPTKRKKLWEQDI